MQTRIACKPVTGSVPNSTVDVTAMTAESSAKIRHRVLGAVKLVLDDKVVELIQGILSLVGLGIELLHQARQTGVVVHAPPMGLVQKPLRERHITFDLVGVKTELRACNVRLDKLIGQVIQHAANEPTRCANSRIHLGRCLVKMVSGFVVRA